MPTHIGIGFSQKLNIVDAAEEASLQAKALTQQSNVDLAIIFSTIHYNPEEIIPIVRKNFGNAKIIGSSTAGVITANMISMHGMTILAITSDEIHFAIESVDNIGAQDLRLSGNLLAKNIIKDYGQHPRQAFVYFADGLVADHSLILDGLRDVFGNVFPVVGAGSSDDFHFSITYQFCQGRVMTNAVSGLLVGGHLKIGVGNRHGWKPLGKPRSIDKADGNVIRTISGKPASSIYDEYFGEQAENFRTTRLGHLAILYPLGIYIKGEREYLLRNVVSVLNDGSILCQGHVPEDSEVHIMISNKESCIKAARDAAIDAQKSLLGQQAKLIIIFESLARHKLLGRSAFQEIKAIKNVFEYPVPIIGMYTYGEICPPASAEETDKVHLQNESITILALG